MISLFFRPVIWFLNQLKFTAKFALIFVLFLMPVIYIAYTTINSHSENIVIAEKEKQGVDYLISLKPLYINMAQARGMTNAYLKGEKSLLEKIKNKHQHVNDSLKKLKEIDQQLNADFHTGNTVAQIAQQWQQLQQESLNLSPVESFKKFNQLIAQALSLNELVIETSGLILDSTAISHFLMSASFQHMPTLIENMGKARGVGAGISATTEFSPDSFIQLVNYINSVDTTLNDVKHAMEVVFEYDSSYKDQLENYVNKAEVETNKFLDFTRENIISADNVDVDSVLYFDKGTKAIGSVSDLFDEVIPVLKTSLIDRIEAYKNEMLLSVVLGALLLVLAMYIFIGFYSGMMDSINRIVDFVDQVAAGDLTGNIQLDSKDEIKEISDDLNLMVQKIHSLVSQVINNANIVAASADESSVTANQTLQGVNVQNGEIDQVATAMNEMSATVHEVAQNAASTSEATQKADDQTNNGRSIVKNTIQSINSVSNEMQKVSEVIDTLETDSSNISTVLDVIKSIAEQTNLLALNAAIEAARAGEQGRGFAVVADEVRTLASRTQASTAEIHDIIEKIQQGASNAVAVMQSSTKQTQKAVNEAAEAGSALEAITNAVDNIAQMNFQIASAAEEQSQVAEEINRNVVNVSNIAVETVEGANKTAVNSDSLKEVAAKLQSIVSEFKV